MPYRLGTHVLTVDANVIHKVDTCNPASLCGMWTVFSRCADSVDQGRRLENLSWRMWQRETFVVDHDYSYPAHNENTKALPQDIPTDNQFSDLPQLSGSVDSLVDEEALEFTSVSAPVDIGRPRVRRQDSCISRREGHISSDDFEKMIMSIVKDKAPLAAPPSPPAPEAPQVQAPVQAAQVQVQATRVQAPQVQEPQVQEPQVQEPQVQAPQIQAPQIQAPQVPRAPSPAPKMELPLPPPAFERSGSTTSESESSPDKSADERSDASPVPSPTPSRTTVVRGFSPSQVPIPRTIPSSVPSITTHAIPEPTSSPAAKPVQSKKQPARFALGGSCSSSEQDQSLDNRKPIIPIIKKPMFTIGGSSEEDGSLKSALAGSRQGSLLSQKKKRTSFANNVMTHTIDDEAAIDSDTDYIDESAIDDDEDSSDWEDSNEEDSGKSSVDDKLFQRVDSKRNLTSRPSLITLMLAQGDRAKTLGNHASQSTSAIPRPRLSHNGPSLGASPNDSDDAPLMMKGMRQPSTLRPIHEIPRSSAQPIQAQAALSPRTTRRNMLATELTESLRRHLLWERQQKSSTANAVLKRRHTSHDVANLKQYPEKSCIKASEDVNASSWNQYFSKEASNGYHSKGW